MKKSTKIWLGILITAFILGGILDLCGYSPEEEEEVIVETEKEKVTLETLFPKHEHEMGKKFVFASETSTAYSDLQPYCTKCDNSFRYYLFRGTPTDLSYLEVIEAYSDSDEIVWGEYYTMKAPVTHKFFNSSPSDKVRVSCTVELDNISVYFVVEFKEEFREEVALLEEGDEITFRGRFYDEGCGFTECELIGKEA